ncbi:hypothetical protein ACGFZB_40375 [Streptomyces cinerochromogenes]|uniref:Lipoprotein n=1 Tax=Streptomyces cinerochromogenes TaxID=66422 RepID=A0ABW7BHE6_9ACTN
MYRTTTTAALLVTVAVSALSGCVTVGHPAAAPAAPPDTAPTQPTAPRPDGSAEPRVVQAPAREALEMVSPSRHPARSGPPVRHRAQAAPGSTHRPPAPPGPPRPARTGPPHTTSPTPHLVPAPDVCALGKRYGGWQKDSPEARICEQAYDH